MYAHVSPRRRCGGFSLPEVAMAIGIIAIAFVALIALIPAGLKELRTAMDSNNETRIVQSMVTLALATEYEDLQTLEEPIYYFDDEGSPLDTSLHEEERSKASRLYAAKIFIEPGRVLESPEVELSTGSRMIVVFGSLYEPSAKDLPALTLDSLKALLSHPAPGKPLKVRTVTIAKTDGIRPGV